MYDLAQRKGYSEPFDVRAIAREFGENESMKVFNAGKLLEQRNWIIARFDMGGGIDAWLTGEGAVAVEQGGLPGIIPEFRRDPARFLVVDHSTHYHGAISGHNIAINSHVGSQSSTSSTLFKEVFTFLNQILTELKQANRLAEADRQDLLDDLQKLRSELQRPTRRAGIIREILSTLANVAEISDLVLKLSPHLPKF